MFHPITINKPEPADSFNSRDCHEKASNIWRKFSHVSTWQWRWWRRLMITSVILIMKVTLSLFLQIYISWIVWLTDLTCQNFFQQTSNYVLSRGHCQKLTRYLFQNYVALYLEFYWKWANLTEIHFWCLIKLKVWSFYWKRNKRLSIILMV